MSTDIHTSVMAGMEVAKDGKGQLELMAAEILSQARQGNAPWLRTWTMHDIASFAPRNAVTGKPYTGKNALYLAVVMMSLGLTDGRFCTFKQAKDAGWKIRKGAKSVAVVYYGTHVKRDKDSGEPLINDEGKTEGYRFAKLARVFHASDVEGMPALQADDVQTETVRGIDAPVAALIQNYGVPVAFTKFDAWTAPHYVPSVDRITVPRRQDFADAGDFNEVVLHELSHATASRVKREVNYYGAGRAAEELTAHISAWLTALQLQVPFNGANAGAYVRSWEEAGVAGEEIISDAVKSCQSLCAAVKG